MEYHQYANLFPLMQGREFEELKKDIAANGQREPIWVYYDQILDGRNRYRACQELNISPKMEIYAGDTPLKFVISLNLHRRHLNESQRAMVAAKLANVDHGGDRKTDQAANLQVDRTSRAESAQMLNVSERSVNSAKKVQTSGIEQVAERVNAGSMAVSAAAEISSKTPEKQLKIIEKLDSGEAKNVKQALRKIDQEDRIASSPIITDNRIRIEQGDCLELVRGMSEMPHVVITDPPYGVEVHNTRSGSKDYPDGRDYAIELLDELCRLLVMKSDPDAHFYFFSGYTCLQEFIEILSKHFDVQKNPIIWVKDNHTMCDFSRWYPNKHEYILFAKQKGSERKLTNCVPDVLSFKRERSSTHSAEKPTELLRLLIEQSTKPGEIVLDPFLGSGSTGVAAKELDRQFIGFELEQEWYEVARSRLA